MIRRTNIVLEGKWKDFMSNYKRQLNDRESFVEEVNGYRNKMFYYKYGLYHVWANDGIDKYDIKLLDIIDNRFPIVVVICFDNCEEIEMFDENGRSRSEKYTLDIESTHFEKGDYIKTDMGAIGIVSSGEWLQCGIWNDGSEYVKSNCCGIPVELCSNEEIKLIDELLYVNDMHYNKETKNIEKYENQQ